MGRSPSAKRLSCGGAAIVPAPPTSSPRAADIAVARRRRTLSVRYHLQVASLVVVTLLCLLRTLWLLLLTVFPNAMMNRAMATAEYEHGNFWRVIDPHATVVGVGVAGLAVVAFGYVLLPFLFTSRWLKSQSVARRVLQRMAGADATGGTAVSLLFKTADLALQCVFLVQQLEAGMPVRLVSLFASVVALNAATAAVLVWRQCGVPVFIDLAFDFAVAVVYPVCVVVYCIQSFTIDRALIAINAQIFFPTAFERTASLYADPVQVAVIRHSLDSLRIRTVLDIFTRVGVNGALCLRCFTAAQCLMIATPQQQQPPSRTQHNGYARHRLASGWFATVAIATVVVTAQSIRQSARVCAPHPACVQAAHRWVAATHACPCIAIIDRELYVRTVDEWTNPRDVTDKVAQLALSGDLQTLQLVNRALPTFPETLRRCTNMRHISLVYTHTQVLPDWVREFSQLEYLHVEGKLDASSLHALPTDVFRDMASLTFLHLAQHPLPQLPSLDGLVHLKVLTLAMLPALDELPPFQHLGRLERLTLVSMPRVETLPDLTNLRSLQSLTGFDRGAYCCNGFLSGQCDLTDAKCREHPLWKTPAATCLPPERYASAATLALVRRFFMGLCAGPVLPREAVIIPTDAHVRQCNGTLFRQCQVPDSSSSSSSTMTGICSSTRWMAISCDDNGLVEAMRRVQIARGLGLPCDPTFEAWLGCRAAKQ